MHIRIYTRKRVLTPSETVMGNIAHFTPLLIGNTTATQTHPRLLLAVTVPTTV